MSLFVKAHAAGKPRSKDASYVAIGYAGVLAILALCQLFTFDRFPLIIADLNLPGGTAFSYVLPSLIVVAEIFAIPFLLRMKLSNAMRYVCMVLGWLVAGWWLFVAIWLEFVTKGLSNSGILSDTVAVQPGWWMIWAALALVVIAAWASWGLWPGNKAK